MGRALGIDGAVLKTVQDFTTQGITKKYGSIRRDDWSIDINGLRHEHVSSQIIAGLVEASMIIAEKSLIDAVGSKFCKQVVAQLTSSHRTIQTKVLPAPCE
jgi:hypothetical protein